MIFYKCGETERNAQETEAGRSLTRCNGVKVQGSSFCLCLAAKCFTVFTIITNVVCLFWC